MLAGKGSPIADERRECRPSGQLNRAAAPKAGLNWPDLGRHYNRQNSRLKPLGGQSELAVHLGRLDFEQAVIEVVESGDDGAHQEKELIAEDKASDPDISLNEKTTPRKDEEEDEESA